MTEKTKRHYFTREQKLELLNQLRLGGMTISEFARRKGIHPVTIHKWKREMGSDKKNEDIDIEDILKENERLKSELKHLKEVAGELAIDKKILETANDILKKSQIKRKLKSRKKSSKS